MYVFFFFSENKLSFPDLWALEHRTMSLVWLNGWVFVYELNDTGFKSRCSLYSWMFLGTVALNSKKTILQYSCILVVVCLVFDFSGTHCRRVSEKNFPGYFFNRRIEQLQVLHKKLFLEIGPIRCKCITIFSHFLFWLLFF